MHKAVSIQKKLIPDLLRVMETRYTILQRIQLFGSIGRRALATNLQITERVLRAELDILRTQGLLHTSAKGMTLTETGIQLMRDMEPIVKELFSLFDLEKEIRSVFGTKQVYLVPGDCNESEHVKVELGRLGSAVLAEVISPHDIIAVMGGSTMAYMGKEFSPSTQLKTNWFVPARGGLGERVDYQANTIAAELAKRSNAKYRMLHIPDHLNEEAYQSMIQMPNVKEVVEMIRKANIVVHGIGDAQTMANRRRMDEQTKAKLKQSKALAEAFGFYFDRKGEIVARMTTAELRLGDIACARQVIAIAGGRKKGTAIAAVLKFGQDDILIADEAAAREALKFANG